MASATSCCFGSIFRFTFDISQFDTKPIESSEIRLSDVNWKIQLRKKSTDDGSKIVLGVYLVSTFDDSAANLSCEAQAAFKLLRNDNEIDQSIVKYLRKQQFSNLKQSHGFDEFIDWDDFLAHFVSESKAIFKVEISAEPLHRLTEMNIEQEYAKLHVLVKPVSELESCFSPVIIVRGIKWKVLTKKNDDDLAIFLCADKLDMGKNWFYKVDCTFQLLSLDETDNGIKKVTTTNFHYDADDWGYLHFAKWSDFTSQRFTFANKANFLIEFKVHEPKPLWKLDKPNLSNANSSLQCCVCFECFTTGNISTIKCGHLFCVPCFTKSIKVRKVCPMCTVPTNANELHPIFFT